MIRRTIDLGVRKFNVNIKVREAHVAALRPTPGASETTPPDLMDLMRDCVTSMQAVVVSKMRMFGSSGCG